MIVRVPKMAPPAGGRVGIEREALRISSAGAVSARVAPKQWGEAAFHPHICKDFLEAQPEFITSPMAGGATSACGALRVWMRFAANTLPKSELLWPLAMPPALPAAEDDLAIARFGKSQKGQRMEQHREWLAAVGGAHIKKRQSVCGVHINVSFSEKFLRALCPRGADAQDFINQAYFRACRAGITRAFFLVHAFGASPLTDGSYPLSKPFSNVISLRNSSAGYGAAFVPPISWESLPSYIASLKQSVAGPNPALFSTNSAYASVRPKAARRAGEEVEDALSRSGITYLEFRALDPCPFSASGVSHQMVRVVEALALAGILQAEEDFSLGTAEYSRHSAAENGRNSRRAQVVFLGKKMPLADASRRVADEAHCAAKYLSPAHQRAVARVAAALEHPAHPHQLPFARMLNLASKQGGHLQMGLFLAKQHAANLTPLPAATLERCLAAGDKSLRAATP